MNRSISKLNPIITLKYISNAKENQYFDRKSARKEIKEITKHIIAFANASGGFIVIGIEDKGTITGFNSVGLHKIDSFKRIPYDYCKTMPTIEWEKIKVKNNKCEDDSILICHIYPNTKRVIKNTSDEVFLRIGDQSKKLTYEQIRNLEFDKGERYFEEEIVNRSSKNDIDYNLLASYKEILGTTLSSEDILEGRGLLVNENLTVAGVLLFSKNPAKFFPNARLRFLRYEGIKAQTGERINLIKDINVDGPIPNIIRQSKDIIASQLRDFQTLDKSGKFNSVPEYPEFAWLEGIVNALTHRDYSHGGEHIKVIMYDDRLEIHSPGNLPNIVDLENMKYTRYSRNPIIARTLSEFGWVKELNEGVKRIYEEMEKYFLKTPEYSEPNGNSVLLKLENNFVMRQIRNSERMTNILEDGLWDKLTEDEKTILYIAYRESNITTKKASKALNRSIRYCRNLLNKLEKLDILVWRGSARNDPTQYYELNLQDIDAK